MALIVRPVKPSVALVVVPGWEPPLALLAGADVCASGICFLVMVFCCGFRRGSRCSVLLSRRDARYIYTTCKRLITNTLHITSHRERNFVYIEFISIDLFLMFCLYFSCYILSTA